jgi:predicted nuclease of predicted toxin-antitoxin system
MRFLADMGVGQHIVEWLRSQGHDAVHLREQQLQRLPDADIFAKAIAEQRIILTFDLDFGEILALAGASVASLILPIEQHANLVRATTARRRVGR